MIFLITVKIFDLDLFLWGLGINASGRELFFSVTSPFPLMPLGSLFLFYLLLSWLHRVIMWWSGLWIFGLRFFGAKRVFGALGRHLWKSVVRWAVAPGATSIQISSHGAESQACFNLRVNCSLHYLLKASWQLILLLYLNLDGKFEAFLKISDYNGLGEGPNSTKFH